MEILVSIIVPTFNEENQIIFLLKSLLSQKFSQKYEIIIVDNESTDNTIKVIKEFKNKNKIMNIKVITSIGKLGKVRNDGILKSSGRFVAFIDADEIADPNWLMELMKKANGYDGVLGSINSMNPNKNFITKFFDLTLIDRKKFLNKQTKIKIFGTGNLLINQKVFKKGLIFDENFPTAEDGDFSYRFYKKGYKNIFNEKAKIFHKVPETIKQFYFFNKKMAISNLLIFLKHRDYFTFLKLIMTIFYFISPNFIKVYKKNNNISLIQFIFLGLISFFIYLYCYFNPSISIRQKKKISRPK